MQCGSMGGKGPNAAIFIKKQFQVQYKKGTRAALIRQTCPDERRTGSGLEVGVGDVVIPDFEHTSLFVLLMRQGASICEAMKLIHSQWASFHNKVYT